MRQLILGLLLILLGGVTLFEALGIIDIFAGWHYVSSLLVLIIGVYLVVGAQLLK